MLFTRGVRAFMNEATFGIRTAEWFHTRTSMLADKNGENAWSVGSHFKFNFMFEGSPTRVKIDAHLWDNLVSSVGDV